MQINEAYETLSDEEKRKMYDEFGTSDPREAEQQQYQQQQHQQHQHFQQQQQQHQQGRQNNQFNFRQYSHPQQQQQRSNMPGGMPGGMGGGGPGGGGGFSDFFSNFWNYDKKPDQQQQQQQPPPPPQQQQQQQQPITKKTLHISLEELIKGKKIIETTKSSETITFSKTSEDGSEFKLKNNNNNNIINVIKIKNDKNFIKQDRNIITFKEITLEEALLGLSSFTIKGVDGKLHKIDREKVKNNSINPNTDEVIIPNEGLFIDDKKRGNLIVKFKVIFPSFISEDQRLLIKQAKLR